MAKSISDEMYAALMAVGDEALRLKYRPKPVDDKPEEDGKSEETELSDDEMGELENFLGKG